jgi:hypothetical protein
MSNFGTHSGYADRTLTADDICVRESKCLEFHPITHKGGIFSPHLPNFTQKGNNFLTDDDRRQRRKFFLCSQSRFSTKVLDSAKVLPQLFVDL